MRLGCASPASWSSDCVFATTRRIECVPLHVDRNRGDAEKRASDARNRTGLRRSRGNSGIKDLCAREGVAMKSPTNHGNSTTSRKLAHLTITSTNGQPIHCPVASCQSELSSVNSMRNHLRRFHNSLTIAVKNSMPTSLHGKCSSCLSILSQAEECHKRVLEEK